MKPWLDPDIRWQKTGTPDFETFLKTYHIPGRFHAAVPKDVVDAYKTVEHLQVHAWYHWPMYTEAFNKLLFILEMAVKQRAKQKGIALTFIIKKGKRKGQEQDKTLSNLIEEVMDVAYSKERLDQITTLRTLRNHAAHPGHHNFYGGAMIQQGLNGIINIINELFLDTEPRTAQHDQLLSHIKAFKGQCLILDDGDQRSLLYQFRLIDSFAGADTPLYLLDAQRILVDLKASLDQGTLVRPCTFVATELQLSDGGISFTSLGDRKTFTITPTDKAKNTSRHQDFHQLLADRNYKNGQIYQMFYTKFLNEEIEDFRYQWFWR